MSFHFTWLQDFLALAEMGNFSRAAEDRASSQPAFSRRIRALEEWLGSPLVDRSTQPARLTDVGEWFRGIAEDLVARTARLPGEARQVAEAGAASLRIASTHALSFTFLPGWLRGLESRVALGPVALASDVLARCEALMQERKVHFVLAHAHPRLPGVLDAEPYLSATVGHDQLLPVCAPAADREPLHRLDARRTAAAVPVLAYTAESGMDRTVAAVLGRRLAGLRSQVVFTAHLASVLRSMALDGRGIAWLPRSLVADDLQAHRLVPAAGPSWWVDLDIRLYRQRDGVGSVAAQLWEAAVDTAAQGRQ